MNLNQIQNSIVFVRACYDLPNLDSKERIQDSLATVNKLLDNNNQVILLSHWGRPEGQRVPELSLEKMLSLVQGEFETEVEFINQYDFFEKDLSLRDLTKVSKTRLFLYENTRFSGVEASKNLFERDVLVQKYKQIADYFVDEAFPLSHRQEVTNYDLKKAMASTYGVSYKNEVTNLYKIKSDPERPLVVLMAGSKLETKLPLIEKMCQKADKVLIGGELCFTFLQAAGSNIDLHDSKVEDSFLDTAKVLLEKYSDKIVLPIDFVYGELNGKKAALDLGSQSLALFKSELGKAKSIFWNGPLGYYLEKPYEKGTLEIAEFVANLSDTYTVLGGGDSVAVIPSDTLAKFDFVSMGGGATLEYLAG